MGDRIKRLRDLVFDKTSSDAILITSKENVFYYSSFTGGTDASLLITKNNSYVYTDSRYYLQVQEECKGFVLAKKTDSLEPIISKSGIKSIAFEDEAMSFKEYNAFKNKYNVELIPVSGIIANERLVKDNDEIERISYAAKIADDAYSYILSRIKPGISEVQVAAELESFMRFNGAEGVSFETIVASGYRSAMPHGTATDKIIESGDFVTLDFGCVYKGYCSDMTRTVAVGSVSDRQAEVYDIVLKAQTKALESIRAGIVASELDKVARDVIESFGMGQYFTHSLGHGVGILVHEPLTVSSRCNQAIPANSVITDEPGIYIDGEFGVRIEDLVLVLPEKGVRLSNSCKKLTVL